MFGALVYALFGLQILLSSIATLMVAVRAPLQPGSGGLGYAGDGLGAVSVGIGAIFLPYALLALASVVCSRMLAAWARASGGRPRTLHRAHRWSIVLAFAVLLTSIASTAGFAVVGPLPLVLVPLSGVVWGAQFVLTAALLGMYALRR